MNPSFRTLYLRRRSQMLQKRANEEMLDTAARRDYLKVRQQILAKKYGLGETRVSRASSRQSFSLQSHQSFDSLHAMIGDSPRGSSPRTHRRQVSGGSLSRLIDHNEQSLHVVPTSAARASRAMAGDTTLAENYAFAGMHYIFDKHSEAVTVIKFSPNEKTKLACCSKDGTLSIHALSPGPPTLVCTLKGHKRAVTDFDWSLDGDFVVSSSLDQTARLWNAKSGKCLRFMEDCNTSELLCCLFQPANNNFIVTGSIKSQIQTWNVSTGKAIKGGLGKTAGAVKALSFDSSGTTLWCGDDKGSIFSFIFNVTSGRVQRAKRYVVCPGKPITCISNRSWMTREARDPSLLVNSRQDCLLLFRIVPDGTIEMKRSFPISHSRLNIRSAFCPLMSFREGACVVTGSEDMCVYFFDVASKTCVNKLQGHSAAVLCVCWNYDESLLASCDEEGTVIVWNREQ
ncbi:WD repeat-containing protein 13-like isoform X2 [Corticium candelabrum]|uniref:WD repeat-containing protein 13-like isoform X2 n=1 Tax=Corticium candelabrum TaxID=121492 RepID=UPI002E276459|nr:WD repeat-containing protein 13-like isoform X2 [Corticium candelabrum]